MKPVGNAVTMSFIVSILSLTHGHFSHATEIREVGSDSIALTVWYSHARVCSSGDQSISGENERFKRNALLDRINLHRLLTMQVSGNYLSVIRVQRSDLQ